MGGVRIDRDCRSELPGLLVCGEDSGGVHGANRLGGNGVADSTVYGRRAGLYAASAMGERRVRKVDPSELISTATAAWDRVAGEQPQAIQSAFRDLMWEKVGVVRDGAQLRSAIGALDDLNARVARVSVTGSRQYNLTWSAALDVRNALIVGRMVAESALIREESRGAHYRSDFPAEDPTWTRNITVRHDGERMHFASQDVVREPASVAGSP
jgi:succinate dehydrogenase / fumarate reductase flavoprotein subunit/fumarate reductase flavoprotein subunit